MEILTLVLIVLVVCYLISGDDDDYGKPLTIWPK